MLKKAFIILILLTVFIFKFSVQSQASYQVQTDLSDSFQTWSIVERNSIYFLESNKVYFEMDAMDTLEISTFIDVGLNGFTDFIVASSGINASTIKVYDEVIDTVHVASYPWEYEAPEVTEVMFNLSFDASQTKGKYVQLSFIMNPLLVSNQLIMIMNEIYLMDLHFMGYYIDDPFGEVVYNNVSDLPDTAGNLLDSGSVGSVEYQLLANSVHIRITYGAVVYHIEKILNDISFLVKDNLSYYYTDQTTGEPMIYLDYGMQNIPFLFDTTSSSASWRPFTLWNLESNEIYSTDKVSIATHVQTEDANNMYAYFYLPYVEIDDLLSVQVAFDYKYTNDGWLADIGFIKKESNPITTIILLEKGNVTATTPEAVLNAYKFGATAMFIGGSLSSLGLHEIGVPLFYGGLASFIAASVIDEFKLVTTLVQNIESFIPTSTFRTQLQTKYRESTGIDDLVISSEDVLYRLHLGQFDIPVGYEDVALIQESYQTIHVVYEWQSQLVEISRDYIVDFTSYSPSPVFPYDPEPVDTDVIHFYEKPMFFVGIGMTAFVIGSVYAISKSKEGESDGLVAKPRRYQ